MPVFHIDLIFLLLRQRCTLVEPHSSSTLSLPQLHAPEAGYFYTAFISPDATAPTGTMYQISNIYALAAFGTIGGALFGFDVSSMSAWIDQDQYLEYFDSPSSDLQGGVSSQTLWYGGLDNSSDTDSINRSPHPCPLDHFWGP